MGRHSIPDPEDSAGDEQHEEPQTQRFGQSDDPEADYGPGVSEPQYDAPQHGDSEHLDPPYRAPELSEPDFGDSDFERPDPDAFTFDEPDYRQVEFEDLEPVRLFRPTAGWVVNSAPAQPSALRPRSTAANGTVANGQAATAR